MTRTITCWNCGIEGEIEAQGMAGNARSTRLFRHLGHNPFSGHMHYQCPACEIVLLVDPMVILGGDMLDLFSIRPPLGKQVERRQIGNQPAKRSFLERLFQNQTGSC